MLQIGILPPR